MLSLYSATPRVVIPLGAARRRANIGFPRPGGITTLGVTHRSLCDTIIKLSPKGRTEVIRGGSGPKNRAEHHGNVHFGVAPQKPTKNCKKPIFSANLDKHLIFLFFAQKTSIFFSAGHAAVVALGRRGRAAAAAAAAAANLGVTLFRHRVTTFFSSYCH